MKILAAYFIFIVLLIFLFKKAGGRKLSASLWVPFIWMLLIQSRSLSRWLNIGSDFDAMDAEMEGSPIDAAFILVLIILGLRILYLRKDSLNIKGIFKNNKAVIILYGFALLSLLWADFPFIAFKRWIKWFGSLVMVFVILTDDDPKAAINSLIKRCAFILIPLSIVFIKFVPQLGRSYTPYGAANCHGVATQKNGYGMLLLICGIYFAWELTNAWLNKDTQIPKAVNYINPIFLIAIFWQLFFIDSKTSLICLLLGIASIIWLSLPSSRRNPKGAIRQIVIFAVVILILQQFVDIRSEAISSMGRDPTLTDRTNLWAEVLAVPINPWIGTGWDNFWLGDRVASLWERWRWQPRSAHNGYIEIYLYLGIVGIIILLFVLLEMFKKSSALFIRDIKYGCLSLSIFIIALFYNYSESAFRRMSPMWFFLLLFSCLSIPRKHENYGQENENLAI